MALRTSTTGGLELAGLFARALSRTRASAAAPAAAAACSANVGGLSSAHGEHRRTFVTLPKLPFKLEDGVNAIGTFLDGKIAEAKYIHPYMFKQAELVGEDYNGNKYYEIKKGVLYGRHRWFVPKDIYDYSPASVPPEWHGWLHNINNDAPSRVSSRARSPSFAPIPAERLLTLGCSPLIPGEVPGAHLQDGRDVVQVPGLPAQGKLQEEARVRKEEEKLEKVRGLDTFAVGGAILGISSLHLYFSCARARAPALDALSGREREGGDSRCRKLKFFETQRILRVRAPRVRTQGLKCVTVQENPFTCLVSPPSVGVEAVRARPLLSRPALRSARPFASAFPQASRA